MRARILGSLWLVMLTSWSAAGEAYGQRWSVEAQAGRIRAALDPAAGSAQTAAVGLRFDDVNTNIALSVGVPTSAAEPWWGALGGSRRAALYRSGFMAGIDLAGSAYALHDRVERVREIRDAIGRPQLVPAPALSGTAFAGQALPIVGYEAAHFQVHARAGASFYHSDFGDAARERTVVLSDLQLTLLPTPAIALMPALRRFDADGTHQTYAGMSAVAANSLGNIWASIGQWLDMDSLGTGWAAGASWQIHQRAALSVSGRHDVFDALYLNPAQTSWNVGLSVQIGGPTALSAPVPAAYVDGRATIRLDADEAATAPRIAGDFTDWKPQPMQRTRDGWIYTAKVDPGVYNYAFVNEHGEWFVPKDHPGRKDDGMGGTVAVVVVR